MKGKNYKAWDIEFSDFFILPEGVEKLKFLIKFAVLAPSSHNAQPWKFEVADSYICIKPEVKRLLPVSDPTNRHLYISLGCALENIKIAAEYYGLQYDVHYLPDGPNNSAIKINFSKTTGHKAQINHLVFSIPKRRSNRCKYSAQIPDKEFFNTLKQLASEDVEICIIIDAERKNKISDLLMATRYEEFSEKPFRAEMADYKKTNFTMSSFGMPGFSQGLGNAISIISPALIRHTNIMKKVGKFEDALFRQFTPVFIFINAKLQNFENWVKTGEVAQRLLLTAEQNNIQTAPSAIPRDIDAVKKILQTNYQPQLFVRLGYATTIPPHTPRLSALKTIKKYE